MQRGVLEFLERSNAAESASALEHLFERAIGHYGYDRFMYSMLSEDPVHQWHRAPSIMRNYPDDWMSRYMAEGFVHSDPVRQLAFKTRLPFTWDELPKRAVLSDHQQMIMNECDEAGMHAGIGIPFHGPYGEVAGVGVASSNRQEVPDRMTVTAVGIIAHQFHNVHLALAEVDGVQPEIQLTTREREVLAWCAQGKSNWVIGEIMGVSESAVKHQVESCIKKLNADSKITAVLKAIRLRLIPL